MSSGEPTVQYQPYAEPLIVEAPPSFMSWAPEFPDFAGRKAEEPAEYPAYVFVNALPDFPVPDLSWEAEFPDFAKGFEPLVQEGKADRIEVPAPPSVPELSWQGVFPDLVRRVPAPLIEVALSESLEPIVPPTPELSWLGGFPDIIHHLRGLVEGGVVEVPEAIELSWLGDYPDEALPSVQPIEGGAFQVLLPIAPAAPELSWLSAYPELFVQLPIDYAHSQPTDILDTSPGVPPGLTSAQLWWFMKNRRRHGR